MSKSDYSSFVKKILIVILILLLLLLIKSGIHVILLLFAGGLLAILWRGLARVIANKTNGNVKLWLPVVIVTNVLVFGGLYFILAPSVANQVEELSEKIPQAIDQVTDYLEDSQVGSRLLKSIDEDLKSGENVMNNVSKVLNVAQGTLSALLDILLIFVFGVFLAADPKLYRDGFVKLFPKSKRKRVKEVLSTISSTLFRWFVGKIIDMFLTAVLTGIGLWLLDVPLVITFAVFTFFLSFVPNIGPVIAAIPPILVTLIDSPQQALYVALMFTGVQLFETYFITPNVQKRAIQMPPVLLLVIQIFFTIILGILALFLSTPILATFIILIRMVYVEDVLGDKKVS
jgi:predicted PurR-regulated permease PerM